MKIEKVKISELKQAEYNPRRMTKKQYEDLKASLEKFGLVDPIIINSDNTVIGGHQRLKIVRELGASEVPTVRVNLSKEDEKELNIRLNKNTGEFDLDILANNFDMEELKDWGFKDIELGFNIDKIVEGNIEDDHIPEVKESRVKLGDVWELGKHRLMCGDSTKKSDVEKLMNGKKADMVFTDPPYNIDFQGTMSCTSKDGEIITMKDGYSVPNSQYEGIKNDKKTKEEFKSFIEKTLERIKEYVIGGWYVCFSSSTIEELLNPLIEQGMRWKSIIVWNKNQSPMGGGNFRKKYEPIVYGYFNNNFYGKEYSEDDVWDIDRTRKNDLHPTMKPIPLIEKAIGYSSKKNESVLDLFLGSGSTLIACEKTNRVCYGMELDTKYCDVIIERWEQFTGQKAKRI